MSFRNIYNWVEVRLGIKELVEKNLTGYLLPRNINFWYSMGSILLFIFAMQVATGILLLVYYIPEADKAFDSVTAIMNEVPFGWLIRMCHAVGSNMMVLVLLFPHAFRAVHGELQEPARTELAVGLHPLQPGIGALPDRLSAPLEPALLLGDHRSHQQLRRDPLRRRLARRVPARRQAGRQPIPWGASSRCTWRCSLC